MEIFKLAITGSAGSGKSLVCLRLFHLGWPVFDCDRIARQVVAPGRPAYYEMVGLFGPDCVMTSGELDRAKMRHIIVNSDTMRQRMEAIIHPAILESLFEKMEITAASGQKKVAVEVPLLFELGLDSQFDCCVTVAATHDAMTQRIVARDRVPEQSARKMLALQMDIEEKISRSDHVIWNNADMDQLMRSVDELDKLLGKEILTNGLE